MNFEDKANDLLGVFQGGIAHIQEQNKDDFHNKLYLSNVISLMEQFLSSLFIFEIKGCSASLKKLANSDKFRKTTVTLPYALNSSIEEHLVKAMKGFVWHNLNDAEMFYKAVLGFSFNKSTRLINQIDLRHDIVHRNGFNKEEQEVVVTDEKLEQCIVVVKDFITDVHRKYIQAKS
ncbi:MULTISPECIES: hypothetical protein [unclassified Pseudoalteromonas]|uniref:hypothetical protein n=2 Tax=Pseudoalteromonas TaxID=53246 RepID=UPI001F1D8F2F|nr:MULTISPECIES: hypothetical protein [unclassified Pseudoalteromonas]MCF2827116.1 hypothetical protein [Pseudoalteromonas sp. OF5H-5]MCF2925871.1 hypothetical protein [Pseudoalteromonas sp. DL2-H1]